jgi:hypothetical protein
VNTPHGLIGDVYLQWGHLLLSADIRPEPKKTFDGLPALATAHQLTRIQRVVSDNY